MNATALRERFETRLEAFEDFRAQCREVWKNGASVPLRLSLDEPINPQALASVACAVQPRAIGSHILNPFFERTLCLAERFFSLSPDAQRKILIHEACHLGVGGHGERFKHLCHQFGGAMTGADAEGTPLRIERKEGRRYVLAREFPRSEAAQARAWGAEQVRSTGLKHRITY
jgi:hypothetical protein